MRRRRASRSCGISSTSRPIGSPPSMRIGLDPPNAASPIARVDSFSAGDVCAADLRSDISYTISFPWLAAELEVGPSHLSPCRVDGAPCPVELIDTDESGVTERGLRVIAADALRADLEAKYQPAKEKRRAFKREYWDWAVANSS